MTIDGRFLSGLLNRGSNDRVEGSHFIVHSALNPSRDSFGPSGFEVCMENALHSQALRIEAMANLHLCPPQFEVLGRSFPGQRIPPISQQDAAYIQKYAGHPQLLSSSAFLPLAYSKGDPLFHSSIASELYLCLRRVGDCTRR
jgi:hypothetical protein